MPLNKSSTQGFQTFVNQQPPPGVVGDYAGTNPRATIQSPPGGFVSSPIVRDVVSNVLVGRFAWGNYNTGRAANYYTDGSSLQPGFVHRENQAILVDFLEASELSVQAGFMVTLMQRGDFWASFAAAASVGQKVYANAMTGAVSAGATGAGTQSLGFTASIAVTTGVMTVTVAGTGNLTAGMVITGTGVPVGTFITSLGSGTGGTGTYNTNLIGQAAVAAFANGNGYGLIETPFVVCSPVLADAAVTAALAAGTGVLTVSAVSSGVLEKGQYLNGTGMPNGLFITGQLTGTPGGTGTYSTNTLGPAVASTAVTAVQGKLGKISSWA